MSIAGRTLSNAYTGFCCPQEAFDNEYFDTVVTEYARAVTERFTEIHWRSITDSSTGLIETINSWLASKATPAEAWAPIFGQLGEMLAARSAATPLEAAVRLALTLHEAGVPGSWSATLDAETTFRFGRWVLPASDQLRVEASAALVEMECRVSNRPARSLAFEPDSGGWATASDLTCYPQVTMGANNLILAYEEPRYAPEFAFLREEMLSPPARSGLGSTYEAALDVIRCNAPHYLPWIDRTMRLVIPLRGGDLGMITSGSTKSDPGTCHLSAGSNAFALAEMLIHESTHQYYHLLTRAAPVHDGTDSTLYYSPVKRRGRPLPYILLAYHAFGNVLLFTRECLAAGSEKPDKYLVANEAQLLPQLQQLEEPLRTTNALTASGEALWRPISDRINGWS